METKDIKIFCSVYENKSFNSAAKKMYMSAQGIVKVINRLEAELNTTLFVRTHKGTEPTKQADYFYTQALVILDAEISIHNNINKKEKIVFEYTQGILDYLGLDFLDYFHKEYPHIELAIDECSDEQIHAHILSGMIDLGIMTGPVYDQELNSAFLYSEKFYTVLNINHPLAKKNHLKYEDFNDQKISLLNHRCKPHQLFMNKMIENNIHLEAVYEADQLEFNHSRAEKYNCLGQTIEYGRKYLTPQTIMIPFEDKNFNWNIFFVWNKRKGLSNAAKVLMDTITEWWRI